MAAILYFQLLHPQVVAKRVQQQVQMQVRQAVVAGAVQLEVV
jgi:hypothetical protein